ncbi:hypothetical protein GLOIN_2v1845494 [Rhizophagus clarus]|uniref:Actin-like ATPase domain-containing protein n=1 Tax=Rhizophagus clarus TaxID=94130 RepID=A0A8H3M3K8_9GLOM|nr:hypothetical protein GLOIN_2v1845494 [Rhizophagus clarus]
MGHSEIDKSEKDNENDDKLSSKEDNDLLSFDKLSLDENNIRVVVGLDFGTTYSGFAYCHVSEKNPCSNTNWHGEVGQLKTNTILQYDDEYNNVKSWGAPAIAKKLRKMNKQNNCESSKPVELFKLHLGDLLDEHKPKLPVDYRKAITDYLREIGKVIKETVAKRWTKIDYFEDVLLVISVPAEFSDKSKVIMRACAFEAGLIKDECSINLQFTTEPEAAAVYCMNNLEEHNLAQPGTNFMIVDCGGGTVDLTTRKLINGNQLDEITERTGDFCGSTFIDTEFIKYLRKKFGDKPIDLLIDNNHEQMQYLIQQFCRHCKIPFSGNDSDFLYELDIQDTIPILKQYVTDNNIREALEENEWVQLDNAQETCSAMFLVGGFSESRYLQKRIRQVFEHRVDNISVPLQPIAAISRGAAIYGLSNDLNNISNGESVISSRVLKYTYGTNTFYKWKKGDPEDRKTKNGYIEKFECLAKRGTKMDINQEVTSSHRPHKADQDSIDYKLFYTEKYDGIYCDDPGMNLLGKFRIDLPGSGKDRCVLFGMTFGKMEIVASARNKQTGQIYRTTFKFDLDG